MCHYKRPPLLHRQLVFRRILRYSFRSSCDWTHRLLRCPGSFRLSCFRVFASLAFLSSSAGHKQAKALRRPHFTATLDALVTYTKLSRYASCHLLLFMLNVFVYASADLVRASPKQQDFTIRHSTVLSTAFDQRYLLIDVPKLFTKILCFLEYQCLQ